MLWTFAMALANPPVLDPESLAWFEGIWASTTPEAPDGVFPVDRGSVLVVKKGERGSRGRRRRVYGIAQFHGKGSVPMPFMIQEEVWCEPDGAFLQVWIGTGGEPVRLFVADSDASHVTFVGPPGVFPNHVVYRKTEEGVVVERSGTLNGASLQSEWAYVLRPPPVRNAGPRSTPAR